MTSVVRLLETVLEDRSVRVGRPLSSAWREAQACQSLCRL